MLYAKKIISFSFLIILHTILHGHGFGANTLVQLPNESYQTIYALCLESLRKPIAVTSCDTQSSYLSDEYVKIGKKSKTNCYINLGFGNQFNEVDDIVCTPMQEFYVPAYRKWLPAYMLKPGDKLLTSHLTEQLVTYKEFVSKSLKVYMIEVERTHTFFVSKYSILTHNMFLPMAMSLGASIPFGSVVAGSIGSFFGAAAITAGVTFGGFAGVALKAWYDNRIHRYKMPHYDTVTINRYCDLQKEQSIKQVDGCFEHHNKPHISSQHVFPIERLSDQSGGGCVEINVHALGASTVYSYDKTSEQQKIVEHGCFEPTNQGKQAQSSSEKKLDWGDKKKDDCKEKGQYNGPWYNRTEDWINEHPVGQKIKNSLERSQYTNQGKRVFEIIKKLDGYDGFKKGDFIVVDAMHKDHLEVFGRNLEWRQVANFDGTKNEKKTEQGKQESRQKLRKQG